MIAELSPPSGATGVEAKSINDRGQVVGAAYYPQGVLHPVLWEDGLPTILPRVPPAYFGVAQRINNRGHVGLKWWDDLHRFRLALSGSGRDVTLRPLDSPDDVGLLGLNDHDHAVGFAGDRSGTAYAVLWRSHAVVSLGIKGEMGTMALDIDNSDRVVGRRVRNGVSQAFRWHHGLLTRLEPLHEGAHATAVAINNHGRAVGGAHDAHGRDRAVIWSGTRPMDLGTLPRHHSSGASDINDFGLVVGASYASEEGAAVLWEDGMISDLNDRITPDAGWRLYQAVAINNSGQVIGTGTRNGRQAMFLLTPVPEPALGMGLTLGCVMGLRRRMRR